MPMKPKHEKSKFVPTRTKPEKNPEKRKIFKTLRGFRKTLIDLIETVKQSTGHVPQGVQRNNKT